MSFERNKSITNALDIGKNRNSVIDNTIDMLRGVLDRHRFEYINIKTKTSILNGLNEILKNTHPSFNGVFVFNDTVEESASIINLKINNEIYDMDYECDNLKKALQNEL